MGEFARPDKPPLRVHDVALALDDVLVNPSSALARERLGLLDIGRPRLQSAAVAIADLHAFVSAFERIGRSTLDADGDALTITVVNWVIRGLDPSPVWQKGSISGDRTRVGGRWRPTARREA